MAVKLNQILAIEKGVKSEAYAKISDLHKLIQKPDLFTGFKKTYQSNAEDGDKLEPQAQKVQYIATEILADVEKESIKLINIIARKDWSNTQAVGTIKIGEQVILADVPATHLLFLEKQLSDMRDVVAKMPIRDTGDDWKADESTGLMRSDEVKTHRTKKVEKAMVLYPATDKHPAQTKSVVEDVIEGYWTQSKFSGAMARPDKMALLERVEQLRDAVKIAREAANSHDEVLAPNVGRAVFDYLLPKEA